MKRYHWWIAICFLFSGVESIAQKKNNAADKLFLKASNDLFNSSFQDAHKNFSRAFRLFSAAKDSLKMNDCMMGIATSYFMQGKHQEALSYFNKLRNDAQRLKLGKEKIDFIDENIRLCTRMLTFRQEMD